MFSLQFVMNILCSKGYARGIVPKNVEGGSCPGGCERLNCRGLWIDSSQRTWQIGINSLAAILKAMYSASVVHKAISDCNLLPKCMGHPWQYPVHDKTQLQRRENSLCQVPVKLASTYMSRLPVGVGLNIKPLPQVVAKYLPMHLTACSYKYVGVVEYRAQLWTAIKMSGPVIWAR